VTTPDDSYDCDLAGLFEGYGGLTTATQSVLGGELGWYSENDTAASKVLAHHHPDVPNLGDITAIDWATVPRPRVLTGGFPCQDVSSAGRRLGLRPDSRSGLWQHMAYAINQLHPQLVVIENVRGILSADAACDVEPCPWCLGDNEGRPLRALGAVLGDLADLGYNTRWGGLRAADVGAPHSRYRIFITAWPAAHTERDGRPGRDPDGSGAPDARRTGPRPTPTGCSPDSVTDTSGGELQRRRIGGVLASPEGAGEGEGSERERHRDAARDGRQAAAHADGLGAGPDAGGSGPTSPAGASIGTQRRSESGPVVGGSTASDPYGLGPVRRGTARGRRSGPTDHDRAAADATGIGRTGCVEPRPDLVEDGPEPAHADSPRGTWGDYEPAIRRWELTLGRPAPAPTQTGARGGQQLSPKFVEWMMGLPAGWVTDVPGITRNDQLKMLGNGVVPQQAAAALHWLLTGTSGVAA
jgi:DNA (cytosine-5)-methyltransferase 1